tara:strand:+ start:3682 stop:4557 length:876 start_codon:yes stop_codon:yes gene_type:complete
MKKNNIYVSTTFTPDNTPLSFTMNLCEENGLDCIEIGSNHCYENNYDFIKDYQLNFLVHNYFPIPKKSFVVNIASFDEEIRKMSIDHIRKAINLCDQIGAKLYTFHPGFLTDPDGSNIDNKNYDFQWDDKKLRNSNFEKATSIMYESLNEIIYFSKSKNIKVAIETEGSVSKKNHLLMQRPIEYRMLMQKFNSDDIGINLNIGHLNLASKAFNFDKRYFIDLIEDYIVAMELSHNEGHEDDHLPLKEGEWYWDTITNKKFCDVLKILECRNTSVNQIAENIKLIVNKINAV